MNCASMNLASIDYVYTEGLEFKRAKRVLDREWMHWDSWGQRR